MICTRCTRRAKRDHTLCAACLDRYWTDHRRRREALALSAWGEVVGVIES